jgi:hypothetical protein
MTRPQPPTSFSRRDVLAHGSLALAASALTPLAHGAPGPTQRPGKPRRIGLVGCGGRGGGAAVNA